MEGTIIVIALCVAAWLFCEERKAPKKIENNHRSIIKVGIFNRYEVTIKGYYGLCGTTKKEVDVGIGIATFDSHRYCVNGTGIKVPSDKKYFNFIAPSNYKLIKSDFIKKEDQQ